jgi:hypothetical protein
MPTYSNTYHYVPQSVIGIAQTPQEYFEVNANLGSYQYVTLKEVVEEMLVDAINDDSYIKNIRRSHIISKAYQGIRKLTERVAKKVYAIEMQVGNDLWLPMPQFYLDYVRISVIMGGKLMPLNINKNINTSVSYLQDSNSQIIFDSNGQVITSDGINAYAKGYQKYEFCDNAMGGQFELDTSVLSKYGEVKIDELNGRLAFSSDLLNKLVVMEYYSDGLELENIPDAEIKIHKQLREPLTDWIYYACIARNRNVSDREKRRALDRYKTTAHQALILRSDINLLEISRLVSIGSKQL